MSLKILLADDHVVVRQGLRALLGQAGLTIVGEASDGHEAVQLARELRPNAVVLDLAMPRLNGLDAAREIMQVSPRTATILLTLYTEDHHVLAALRAGISAYVVKTQAVDQLVAEGKTTKEIADILSVSSKTAESHRGRIMEKLGIHNTAGLVRYSIRHGLIEP